MTRRLIVVVVVSVLFVGCEKAKLREDASVEIQEIVTEKSFPFFRDLTDAQGRVVEAEVLGRDQQSVIFVRWSDKKRFTVPIASLSQADQTYLLSIPMAEPRPTGSFEMDGGGSGDKFENKGYVAILEGRIEDKRKKLSEAIEIQRESARNSIAHRTATSTIHKLEKEITEIESEIEDAQTLR